MATMDSTPEPALAPSSTLKKKRKGKRIGARASAEHMEEESTTRPEQTQTDGSEQRKVDGCPDFSVASTNSDQTVILQPHEQNGAADHEPQLQLEPDLESMTEKHPPQQEESAIDPLLLALATASLPAVEDGGGSIAPRSKEARRQAFAAAVQTGDELLSAADPAGAVQAYMEAVELGTAGERLQVGRSISNAQLLLCQNLAREAVRTKNAAALSQLILAVGGRAPELLNTFFDEKQGVTLAYFAAQENDYETLQLLLAPAASIPRASDATLTPQRSSMRGNVQNTVVFGGQYRLADQPANNGGTPLFVAAKLGNSLAVDSLISGGCEVDAVVSSPGQPIDGLSALLIATRQGHCDVVQQLLSARADPNQRMADGTAPIHVATAHGHGSIIRLLSKAGADVNARKDAKKQVTPLLLAAQQLKPNAVEALIDGGADLSRQVYVPSGAVQTTLRYAFSVALKASRSRPSSHSTGDTAEAPHDRESGACSAEQAAAKLVIEVLQRASRRPVLAAHQRLSLAKLLPPAATNVRQIRDLSRVFNRIAARMPLPPCQLTVLWLKEIATPRTSDALGGQAAVSKVAASTWPPQNPTSRLALGSAATTLHQPSMDLQPAPQRLLDGPLYGSPRHETRRWEEVAPQEWSTELVRQWSVAVLSAKTIARATASEVLRSSGNTPHSSRLVSAGLAASMVDGEALLGIPSFKVLHAAIGSDIPAGPVLKLWGVLQQLQIKTGHPSSEESAIQLEVETKWADFEEDIERLQARRSALVAAVSHASMELHTDRTLREGIEAELSQTRSQVEWVQATGQLATPTRPRRKRGV